jgi:hypothetical protein
MFTGTLNLGVSSWLPIVFLTSFADHLRRSFGVVPSRPSEGELRTLPKGPRDCVLVLDASRSMAGCDWKPSRIAGAQAAAVAFGQRLSLDLPDARIALVAYGEAAELLCPLTPAGMLQPLIDGIHRIRFSNATNIASGVQAAFDLLLASGRLGQVVLLSDGHNNAGPSPRPVAEALKRLAIVETVGIGGTPWCVDEALLKAIASFYPNGGKRYRWIGDRAHLIQHFDALAGGISRS